MSTDLEDRAVAALAALAAQARPTFDLERVVVDGNRRGETVIDPGLVVAGAGEGPHTATPPSDDESASVVPISTGRRPRRWLPIVATAAAVAGLVGVAVATSRDGEDGPTWGRPGPSGLPLDPPDLLWTTPHVALSAQSITIDYGGRTLSPPADAVAESSVQSRREETMTLRWSEQGIDMAWVLQFKLRDGDWWVEKMTLAEGVREGPGWTPNIDLAQDGVQVPLGQSVVGDVDLLADSGAHTARVQASGLRLLAFRDRIVETEPIDVPPPAPVAPSPLPTDVPPTGMYPSDEEWMAVMVAQDMLTSECMAAAGFDYPVVTDDELLLRGSGRRRAAERGFHDSSAADTSRVDEAIDDLSESDEQAFYEALMGAMGGGCTAQVREALGPMDSMRAWGEVPDINAVRQSAFADPSVIAAVATWKACVFEAVGEAAATPEELMRLYAVEGSRASAHEKDVAVADAECRVHTDFDRVLDIAQTARERAAMGDRVGEYDQWVREFRSSITNAQQVLDERGVVLPTLD
jgi:hypothetical protein